MERTTAALNKPKFICVHNIVTGIATHINIDSIVYIYDMSSAYYQPTGVIHLITGEEIKVKETYTVVVKLINDVVVSSTEDNNE